MLRAGSGDAPAFGLLVHRHGAELRSWFARSGLDAASAEDCVQDTFLRLFRATGRYEPRAPFRAFLIRIAKTVHLDWRRRRRVEVPRGSSPEAELEPSSATGAEDDLLDLRAAMDDLPEKLRAVVELSARRGWSYRRISHELSIPEGTVKSRMYHAVRRLRSELDG